MDGLLLRQTSIDAKNALVFLESVFIDHSADLSGRGCTQKLICVKELNCADAAAVLLCLDYDAADVVGFIELPDFEGFQLVLLAVAKDRRSLAVSETDANAEEVVRRTRMLLPGELGKVKRRLHFQHIVRCWPSKLNAMRTGRA